MNGRRPTLRRAAACALIVLGMLPATGTATSPTPASGQTWNPNQRVEYRWRQGDEPPGWLKPAINAAAADSNSSRASKAATFAYDPGGTSWIAYTGDIPSSYAVGYAVRNAPTSFNIRLRPHGYALDWGTLRWCEFYDSPPNGCYNAEMITLHEFGHVQTLGHVDESDVTEWTDTIMHVSPKTKAKAGWNADEYGRCDVARLQIRYQALTSSTRYSTCLDLPTSISLTASSATVSYGASVTFSAALEVADGAVYASLASDPMSNRRVLLQRRPPGGSWTTVDEMNALDDGSGRYSKSVKITDTYDWRAYFPAPANEGVRGSSSSAVRVGTRDRCLSSPDDLLEPEYETC